jgi:hypothetical protein
VREALADDFRAAFLRGNRYLTFDWGLADSPADVALVVVDRDIDAPLNLDGTFIVRGFEELVLDATTLTPTQQRHVTRDHSNDLILKSPDWTLSCTPATTKADIAAAASVEYATYFGDVEGYHFAIVRIHRVLEHFEIDQERRTIKLVMGS